MRTNDFKTERDFRKKIKTLREGKGSWRMRMYVV